MDFISYLRSRNDHEMRRGDIRYSIVLIIMLLTVGSNKAQEHGGLLYNVGFNSIVSNGDYAPFWFTANRNGASSIKKSSGYARYGIEYNGFFDEKQQYGYNITADILTGYNQTRTFALQQAFAEFTWRWLAITIGNKERGSEQEYFSRENSLELFERNHIQGCYKIYTERYASLGSGGLAFSGNSHAIPQIRIDVPEYTTIPGTAGWLKLRGHLSYGIFSDSQYQTDFTRGNPNEKYGRNILYHSKALFMRAGRSDKFPLTFEGGLEMHTQFGGDIYTHGQGLKVSMPHRPMDFFKAIIPLGGSDDTPTVEQTNISGNQIGSWHAAFTLHTKCADIRIYGEHMFEDFSQLFFFEYQQNRHGKRRIIYYPWRDIMIGVNIANKSKFLPFVHNIRYEYLTTRDQSGALYHDPSDYFNEQMDGCDNYYNHGIYPGWHHWGMGIGNPLIISPIYNNNGSLQFASNRVVAHNIGINGFIKGYFPLAYRLNYTYSENWGTYANPFSSKRYTTSLLAEFTYIPNDTNWMGTLSFGCDRSSYIGNNMGLMLTFTHFGKIFNK